MEVQSQRPICRALAAGLIAVLFCGALAAEVPEKRWEEAESALRKRVPADFTIVRADPFLITGDIPAEQLHELTDGTVTRCSRALYNEFFVKRPDQVITIFLFRDDDSYRSRSQALFGAKPTTKFGYYLAGEQALVMNIATGSGTLVHEMVHPLMAVDFPRSPAWFNEGMGSLFEQCSVLPGPRLRGMVNWRLPILQKALGTEDYVPLEELLRTSEREFYGSRQGVYYAQARYLLLYAQEQGLLRKLYTHFRDHVEKDPTGRQSLEAVFEKPLDRIESEWLSWVKTLRWP